MAIHESLKLIEICQRLYQKDWIASCDGNISYRGPSGTIFITPSGQHKAFIQPQDLAEIDLENQVLSGRPSSESQMHLAVYRQCKKAQAVVHAHPPTAIAWSIAFPELRELPSEYMSELILAVGAIPVVPYARPGTSMMGENLIPFLPQNRVMILARHGAIAWGEDLEEAFRGIERLEHSARILLMAQQLLGESRSATLRLKGLPEAEIEYLREMRKKIGERIL